MYTQELEGKCIYRFLQKIKQVLLLEQVTTDDNVSNKTTCTIYRWVYWPVMEVIALLSEYRVALSSQFNNGVLP